MAVRKNAAPEQPLHIAELTTGRLTVFVKGQTPLIYNRLTKKTKEGLLLPANDTRADRKATLKHDPLAEYRDSFYTYPDDSRPTRLKFPCGAYKKGCANTALRLGGATKTEIAQLMWIEEYDVDIYGIPQLYMTGVRSAGMNRTPDIRTRGILPGWACTLTITYVVPQLNERSIVNLLSGAGLIMGIGDGRQEKGAFNFGQYRLVSEAEFSKFAKTHGRKAQDAAIERPAFFDDDSRELFAWFYEELRRRGDEKKPRRGDRAPADRASVAKSNGRKRRSPTEQRLLYAS